MEKASRNVKWLTVLAALLLCTQHIWRTIFANNGLFIYALDDAYIHLDLAEQLGRTGIYGVNAGVTSSPASSILWPFLLAPFAYFSWLTYVPLALNLLAVVVVAYILPEIITRCAAVRLSRTVLWLLSFAGVLVLNLPALALMGMEHGPHVACALFIALGLLRVLQGETPPSWLWLVIILSPLLRYEGAIISGAALLFLLLRGYCKPVFLAGGLITLLLAAFSLFLVSLGLDALPASTIVKKAGHIGGLIAYLHHWSQLLRVPFILHNSLGMLCILAIPSLSLIILLQWDDFRPQQRGLMALVLLTLLGHLVVGRYSHTEIYRYEYYLLGFGLPLLAYAARDWLTNRRQAFGAAFAVFIVLAPMLGTSLGGIVRSSHVIYLQHESMRQLVQEHWRAPVAANDIGLVGYKNPSFVLDLWGLADSEVLHVRRSGETGWLSRLLAKHNVQLIMINDTWWADSERQGLVKIGELKREVSSRLASDIVTFYTPEASQVPEIKEKLTPWLKNLPPGASFAFTSSTAAPPQ
jgi:hypothetical protein